MPNKTLIEPQIFVVCRKSLKDGCVNETSGWINANQESYEIEAEIEALMGCELEADHDERWDITKWTDFGASIKYLTDDLDAISELGTAIAEHGESLKAYINYQYVYVTADAVDSYLDSFQGWYESEADFAEEYFNETEEIPQRLYPYIDWDSVAEDLFSGDFFSIENVSGVYVFRA